MARLTPSTLRQIATLEPFPQPPVIALRHPVVLMHGFGLMAVLLRGGHLHEEALYMRQHGIQAYAPNVSPYHTVPDRAALWASRMTHVLQETKARKLNLIAHSMGGLDARYLITKLGMHDRVASLITVSTPHRGSAVATMVLEQPDRVQAWISDAANWASEHAMDAGKSDLRQAVREMTPEFLETTFNPEVPDHPDVRYWSYAGRAGKGTDVSINPFLRPLNAYLFAREGVNDGFVSVESARWGTFMGEINADHALQIGIEITANKTFHSAEFYTRLAVLLAEEGF